MKEWITIGGFLITNAGFLFGMWKYFDARISRVYQRFDEEMEGIKIGYVQKENCKLLHENTASNLMGLETRIEKRLDKLEIKLEDLIKDTLSKMLELVRNK